MAWIILFLAGLTEVGWAVGLKYTEGFTRLVPIRAHRRLHGGQPRPARARAEDAADRNRLRDLDRHRQRSAPRCSASMLFGESAAALRLACIGLIVAGIVGLKLVSAE